MEIEGMDNYKTASHNVKKTKFREYIEFLDGLQISRDTEKVKSVAPVEEIKTVEKFEAKCSKKLPCIIAFLNTVKEGKLKIELENF